jgi:hypothetical protein
MLIVMPFKNKKDINLPLVYSGVKIKKKLLHFQKIRLM